MAYPTLESFVSRLSAPTASGCLEWLRSRNAGGYGIAPYWDSGLRKRRSMGAHRMAYILHNGGVAPVEGIVMHTCGNSPCCNPAHLVLVEMADRANLPRAFAPRQRKLTDDAVRAIRVMAGEGHSDMHISLLFDVSDSHVKALRLRTRKAHVPDDGPVAEIPVEYARG